MRILWLLPDLSYTSAARQATLLAPELVKIGHYVEVAVLRSGGPFTNLLQSRGVTIHELATPHDVPMRSVYELEKCLKNGSWDLVHAWRLPSLRSMGTLRLARTHRPKLLVSQARRGGRWTPLDRLLLQRADHVTPDLGEALSPVIPLAVVISDRVGDRNLPAPLGARVILTIGQLTADHGFRDAFWGFDVLKFIYDDLYLVLIGDGPERERLEQFASRLGSAQERAIVIPGRPDASALISHAKVVWVPSRRPCGEQVTLEAQLAGVPVVATNLVGLAAVIADGQNGLLVPPGDPVRLATVTRPLLDDIERGRTLADDAKKRLAANHEPTVVAGLWSKLYVETCGVPGAATPPV